MYIGYISKTSQCYYLQSISWFWYLSFSPSYISAVHISLLYNWSSLLFNWHLCIRCLPLFCELFVQWFFSVTLIVSLLCSVGSTVFSSYAEKKPKSFAVFCKPLSYLPPISFLTSSPATVPLFSPLRPRPPGECWPWPVRSHLWPLCCFPLSGMLSFGICTWFPLALSSLWSISPLKEGSPHQPHWNHSAPILPLGSPYLSHTTQLFSVVLIVLWCIFLQISLSLVSLHSNVSSLQVGTLSILLKA